MRFFTRPESDWNGIQVLGLAEYSDGQWHTAASFRKAVLDRDACETEFATLLKRSKQKVRA